MSNSKFVIVPISNDEAKINLMNELNGVVDNLKRWSNAPNGNKTDKYIGFLIKNLDSSKFLLIYHILSILPAGMHQRVAWNDFYKDRETILFGDIAAIIPYDEFCNTTIRAKGATYKVDATVRGTTRFDIANTLFKQSPNEITTALDAINWNGIFTIRLNRTPTTYENRYEMIIKKSLELEFPDFPFISNPVIRTLDGQTRRPDFYHEAKDHVLFIEYDENNHSDRDINDEQLRMNQLRDHFRPKKTIIIRYGNISQSWQDAHIFMRTVREATKKDYLINDRIILIGYPTNPYLELSNWEINLQRTLDHGLVPPIRARRGILGSRVDNSFEPSVRTE